MSHSQNLPNSFHTCNYCSSQFKRDDHLRRHELNHQEPRFYCSYPNCGKAFRRKDVLKRHNLIHKPGPVRRRIGSNNERSKPLKGNGAPRTTQNSRRPREAISFDLERKTCSGRSISGGFGLDHSDHFLPSSDDTDVNAKAKPSGIKFQAELCFPDVMRDMIDDGLLAYSQRYCQLTAPHLPFIHLSTANDTSSNRELLLALAALGTRKFDSICSLATLYFTEAQDILQKSHHSLTLKQLQAEVLLIEFAAWSGRDSWQSWALNQQHRTVEHIRSLLASPQPNLSSRWANWLHVEELKRTVFAFYCSSVTLAAFFGQHIPLSYHEMDICCPCRDDLWEAPNEATWGEKLLFWNSEDEICLTLAAAVDIMMNHGPGVSKLYQTVSMFGQHVLLCAVLEAVGLVKLFTRAER